MKERARNSSAAEFFIEQMRRGNQTQAWRSFVSDGGKEDGPGRLGGENGLLDRSNPGDAVRKPWVGNQMGGIMPKITSSRACWTLCVLQLIGGSGSKWRRASTRAGVTSATRRQRSSMGPTNDQAVRIGARQIRRRVRRTGARTFRCCPPFRLVTIEHVFCSALSLCFALRFSGRTGRSEAFLK